LGLPGNSPALVGHIAKSTSERYQIDITPGKSSGDGLRVSAEREKGDGERVGYQDPAG
jgi:hypothetical protein